MKEDVSAGVVPYRTTRGKREYLVLKSRTTDWEFPKGGVENDEELQQTALRELEEEASIEGVRLIDGFKEEYSYVFEANGEKIHKTVHLFIGHTLEASADMSKEHSDYQWRTFEQAHNTLTHSSTKDILEQVNEFLQENDVDNI